MKTETRVEVSAPRFAVGASVKRRHSSGSFPGEWRVVSIAPDAKFAKYHEYKLTNDAGHRMAQFEVDLVQA